MSYVLTKNDNLVELKIIQDDNRLGAKKEEPQGEENPVLRSLKELIEG